MKEYIIGVPERTGVEDPAMVPAINQRELVRCKDCKHRFNGCCYDIKNNRTNFGVYVADDWFCADGERKE